MSTMDTKRNRRKILLGAIFLFTFWLTGCDSVIFVHGSVKDETGQPIPNAKMELQSLKGSELCIPVSTNQMGEFDLGTVGGTSRFVVVASKDGYGTLKKEVANESPEILVTFILRENVKTNKTKVPGALDETDTVKTEFKSPE